MRLEVSGLKNELRERVKAQKNVLKEELKNGSIDPNKVIEISQNKLKTDPDDTESRNKAFAQIIAANEIKTDGKAGKEMTGAAFKEYTREVMSRESFQKTLKNSKPEELIHKALDGNGSKLQEAFKKNEKTHAMGK